MTSQHYMTIVLSVFATCYGLKYSISFWNRCHNASYVELFNTTIDKCMLECGLRNSCAAVQYERMRRSCGILTLRQSRDPLITCKKFVYIQRSGMDVEFESCARYKTSPIDGRCITECVVPDNLRRHSTIKGHPSTGSRIKVTCNSSYTLDGNQSIRCMEDGTFSSVPTCRISSDTNVAVGRPTWQSSTYRGASSHRAVDGNTDSSFAGGRSCTHTESERRPWWNVDLEDILTIQTVVVYKRNCCPERFSEVYLFASPTNNFSNHELEGDLCDYQRGPFDELIITFRCKENVRGRYLKIILDKKGYLTLCEVQVFVATI